MKLTHDMIDDINSIFTYKRVERDGEETRIVAFSEFVEEPIKDKFYDLGMEVDDYHYKWLEDCMDQIVYELEPNLGVEIEEIRFDELRKNIIEGVESDPYIRHLFEWVSSRNFRMGYVDHVLQEFQPKTLWDALSRAQFDEMQEIYTMGCEFVEWYLNEYLEEDD